MLQEITHPFPALYDQNSEILILGSFPSVKSREQLFFYGHKQNRFWKVLAGLLGCSTPMDIDEKKAMLLSHHIALWDVIGKCKIEGSSDSSIRDVVPNDISHILKNSNVKAVFTNGGKSYELYQKYIYPKTNIAAIKLPSTSPANAAYSLDKLSADWRCILEYLS